MAQNLHFFTIQCFSEKFTQSLDFNDIPKMLKVCFENKGILEIEDLICVEKIDTKFPPISAYYPKIENFLSTDSQIQLHKDLGYYLVDKKLWEAIKDIIIEESGKKLDELKNPANSKSKKSKSPKDDSRNQLREVYDAYFKDLAILESWYNKKMLILEVS
ncbi:hypothetical protein [Planktothrix pseudagardhii]|uniref:Uncharacterized protein n=1 Tax=Planktothrix pseudagardhii TaxID=132604 RepID=A0A9W4CVC4_9CYAN|nr:hypothetical protein [Planktothrix pseudagardhii]CAD5924889.1 hypothetical protein NO713_00905 [Planktothrix pseudagardhii]